jgi:uridine kinase
VHDIFLLPPGEDPQGCHSWLRMRNKQGRYSLMFAEYVVDDPFIVSPRVSFEVPVRLLGGLMALGYSIGSLMSRLSFRVVCKDICVKWDRLEKLGSFMQFQGENRCVLSRSRRHCRVGIAEVMVRLGVLCCSS